MNAQRTTDERIKGVAFDKVLFLFLVIFNIVAVLTFYEFNTIIVDVLVADVVLIAILRLESVIKTYIGSQITMAQMSMRYLKEGHD